MPYKDKNKKNECERKSYQRHRADRIKKHKIYYWKHHKWFLEYQRRYKIEHPDKIQEWINKNKDRIKILAKRSRNKYKFRQHQRSIAIRYFKKENKCFDCNSKENLEFHHINYRDNIFMTLCIKCHKIRTRKYK